VSLNQQTEQECITLQKRTFVFWRNGEYGVCRLQTHEVGGFNDQPSGKESWGIELHQLHQSMIECLQVIMMIMMIIIPHLGFFNNFAYFKPPKNDEPNSQSCHGHGPDPHELLSYWMPLGP